MRKFLDREQAIQLAVDGILGAAYRWWPDVILCVSAFFVPPWLLEVLRARGHTIIMLMTEGPYQTDYQLKMAAYADLTLLNDPVGLDAYRQIGPAEYMPHSLPALDPLPARARHRTRVRLRVRRDRVPVAGPGSSPRWTWPG